jgi:cell division septation protein DedD
MIDERMQEDSSHYEISLTAGQALTAFVLLLLSLAASFAFGVIIGRGDGLERMIVEKSPSIITEGKVAQSEAKIVELGVPVPVAPDDALEPVDELPPPATIEAAARAAEPRPASASPAAVAEPAAAAETPAITTPPAAAEPAMPAGSTEPVPHFVQLLSTGDAKAAEALAARLIEEGFLNAYVERTMSDTSTVHRVRVRYPTEREARAAAPRLAAWAKGDVWVARQ